MKRLLFLVLCLCVSYQTFSQTTIGENAIYFHRVTDKPFSELNKKEVAFIYKGEQFYMKGCSVYRMRFDKPRLAPVAYGEVYEMLKDCPDLQHSLKSSHVTQNIGGAISTLTSIPLMISFNVQSKGVFFNPIYYLVPAIGGGTVAFVGVGRTKRVMREFYNDYLLKLPPYDPEYSDNYVPETFIKLTNKKVGELSPDETAFTYDGENYFIRNGRVLYKECPSMSSGKRKVVGNERLNLMNKQGTYSLRELGKFYDEMNTDKNKAFQREKPSRVAPVEQTTQSKVESQKSDSVVAPAVHSEISTKNDEVSAKTESSEAIIAEEPKKEAEPVAAPAENVAAVETVAKEEPKAVKEEVEKEEKAKEEKVKEEKVKKERGPKLNERKRNGYGIFVDAGGALFEGPRLGLEMRFNRCIPSVFVGYPNFGYFFKKDHEDISDLQSISAGAGVKGLVPMRIGGFYAGGTLLYERYAGETNPSTVESQKVLYNDGSVLANIGFRFQTKFNLFFNLGFMAGPNFSFGNARFSNPLNYDYTPKYQSEDMKISLKKMGELSIGYEF